MVSEQIFDEVDYEGLAREIKALQDELEANLGPADLAHLRKIERWGWLCSFLGYATAWIFPNPIAALLMSQGILTRWIMMHHVGHKGYDRVPGVSPRHTSARFAKGWRRLVDFMDWLLPEAWKYEHNILHHYHTGEIMDPDVIEINAEWLRRLAVPRVLKYLLIALGAMTWKWTYYAPQTLLALHEAQRRRAEPARADDEGNAPNGRPSVLVAFNPFTALGRTLWLQCFFSYALFRFVFVPALFLPLGTWVALSVLLTSLMAEVFTNVHAFLVIGPSHTGDDLYRFETPISDRAEFYLRGVIGSVNYRTGGDFNDFCHAWLNYQIEHHLWPNLTLLKYQQAQPRLKRLCEQYGVPYVQAGLFDRVAHTLRIMTGETSMRKAMTLPRDSRVSARPLAIPPQEFEAVCVPAEPAY